MRIGNGIETVRIERGVCFLNEQNTARIESGGGNRIDNCADSKRNFIFWVLSINLCNENCSDLTSRNGADRTRNRKLCR